MIRVFTYFLMILVISNKVLSTEWKWFKGNTHTHTELSGHGDSSPEFVTKWYHDRGYNFLVLSEHNLIIDPHLVQMPSPLRPDFILISGQEVTGKRHVHTTAMNVSELVPWDYYHESKNKILQNHVDEIKKRGGEAISNHPNWFWALSATDLLSIKDLKLFELYNGHPHVHNDGDENHDSTELIWDKLLSAGKKIFGVSSDDAHYFKTGSNKSNPGRGWVMVRAKNLGPDSITLAMRKGDFYSSSGVILKKIVTTDNYYKIVIDKKATLKEINKGYVTGKIVKTKREGFIIEFIGLNGKILKRYYRSRAKFSLRGHTNYVRSKIKYIRKENGHWKEYSAWGMPVFLPGLD